MYPEHALPGTGARWASSIATPGPRPVTTAPGTTHPLSEAQSNLGNLGKGKSRDDRGKRPQGHGPGHVPVKTEGHALPCFESFQNKASFGPS